MSDLLALAGALDRLADTTGQPRVVAMPRTMALVAAGPALAATLAGFVRDMETQYADHMAGQSPAVASACICRFCEHRRACLAAVEPLLPLLGAGAPAPAPPAEPRVPTGADAATNDHDGQAMP
jgi:hypothetical protein